MNHNSFYHRRQFGRMEWVLYLDYAHKDVEYWIIKMSPVRKDDDGEWMDKLLKSGFHDDMMRFPDFAKLVRTYTSVRQKWHYQTVKILKMEFEISIMDNLPTRHSSVDALCKYMIKLSHSADQYYPTLF